MIVSDSFPIKKFNGIAVNTSLLSDNRNYYNYSSRNVKYIVIHYTGNNSDTAKANANHFNGGSRGTSAHYFVDEKSCYQSVELNNAAWAVGGTKKYKHSDCRNLNSISIEMCCSGNFIVSDDTVNNAAYLCAELCKYLKISTDEVDKYVLRHYDVWNKSCPAQWASVNSTGWTAFKEKVKLLIESEEIDMEELKALSNEIAEMKKELRSLAEAINKTADRVTKVENPMIYNNIDKNMPDWAKEGIQYCIDNGITKGTGEGLGLDDKDLKYCTMIKRIMERG